MTRGALVLLGACARGPAVARAADCELAALAGAGLDAPVVAVEGEGLLVVTDGTPPLQPAAVVGCGPGGWTVSPLWERSSADSAALRVDVEVAEGGPDGLPGLLLRVVGEERASAVGRGEGSRSGALLVLWVAGPGGPEERLRVWTAGGVSLGYGDGASMEGLSRWLPAAPWRLHVVQSVVTLGEADPDGEAAHGAPQAEAEGYAATLTWDPGAARFEADGPLWAPVFPWDP